MNVKKPKKDRKITSKEESQVVPTIMRKFSGGDKVHRYHGFVEIDKSSKVFSDRGKFNPLNIFSEDDYKNLTITLFPDNNITPLKYTINNKEDLKKILDFNRKLEERLKRQNDLRTTRIEKNLSIKNKSSLSDEILSLKSNSNTDQSILTYGCHVDSLDKYLDIPLKDIMDINKADILCKTYNVVPKNIAENQISQINMSNSSIEQKINLVKKLYQDNRPKLSISGPQAGNISLFKQGSRADVMQSSHQIRISGTVYSLRKIKRRIKTYKIIEPIILSSDKVSSLKFNAVIDTASDLTLCDSYVLEKMQKNPNFSKEEIIKDLDRSRISAFGCELKVISLGNGERYKLHTPFDFYIINGLEEVIGAPILVGLDIINIIREKYGSYSTPIKNDYKLSKEISEKLALPIKIEKENYEKELFNTIDEYIKVLNKELRLTLSKDFKDKSIKIYNDIINSIQPVRGKTRFSSFYEKIKKGKGPKYTAGALLYYSLLKENYKINKSKLAANLGIGRSELSGCINSLFHLLINIPDYEYIFDIPFASIFTQNEYKIILQKFINQYIDHLANNIIDIQFSENDKKVVLKFFTSSISLIKGKDKYNIFYKELIVKSPKMLAATLCLTYIRYFKDFDIDGTHFIEILNTQENFNLNAGDFRHSYHQFISRFFKLEKPIYRNKVVNYFNIYINSIKSWLNTHLRDKEKIKSFINEFNQQFIDDAMAMYASAIENGFQINMISRNVISYFFPQTMALSLLFFTLKSRDDLEELASAEKFRKYFQSENSIKKASLRVETITSTINNRLYSFIKDTIGRYKGQIYTRKTFIKTLNDSLKEGFHPEIEFFLKLYKITGPRLTPYDFAKKLDIQGGKLKRLIREYITERRPFKETNTFKKIKDFIRDPKNIPSREDQIEAFSWINELQESRMIYTRKSLITKLNESLKNFYHIDTEFLLLLYKIADSNLEPMEFAKRLGIYGGYINSLIKAIVDDHSKFTAPKTFKDIKSFILNPENKISKQNQTIALTELRKIQELRRKDFTHRGILYAFHWIKNRLNIIRDNLMKKCLFKYLSDIEENNFPINIFKDLKNPRVSNLQFIGTKKVSMKTEIIEKYFKDKFLTRATTSYNLCKNVKEIFNNYKIRKIGVRPDHPPILSGILMNNDNALGIEVPVWKGIKNSNNFFIGHIDLLLFKGNSLIIADYKQDQAEIFKAIPQITAYGIMLKERLKKIGYSKTLSIKCVGFSKDVAWEFDPEIVKNEIPKFIEYEMKISKRKTPLLIKDKKSSLSDSIDKLILFIQLFNKK